MHLSKKAEGEVEMTEEQKKLMRTQDMKYVEMKRVAEANVGIFIDKTVYIKMNCFGFTCLLNCYVKPSSLTNAVVNL